MDTRRFDLAVLGGGPGGYVAAIRARQLGMKVALVEREHLGGICLNWGCIPTKALLHSAEVMHLLKHASAFGLKAENIAFDTGETVARSRRVAARLARGVEQLLKKNRVAVFTGHGRLAGPGRLAVAGKDEGIELAAPHIVLATGARPRQLPAAKADGRVLWTYKEAMVPKRIPASLLVIGAGAIGIEFASFYREMGAEVSVVEAAERILPAEDAEISALAHQAFAGRGIAFHTGTSARLLAASGRGARFALEDGAGASREVKVERAILAIGIRGNVEDIGLEGTAVAVENHHVAVDRWQRTGEDGIYAIGDLAGPPWLAHKASHEGILCVERIAGLEGLHPPGPGAIPACTYSRPQIASIGLTEEAARAAGHELRIGRFPFAGNGKAIAMGSDSGLVKTVFDANSGALLGAHMIGAEVTELIGGYAVARTLETTEAELMATIFPHPTLSEAMHEAVLAAWGRAIHI